MSKNWIIKILFCIFLIAGCSFGYALSNNKTNNTNITEKSPIKIGMTAPLSGELQSIGEGERTGIQIYFAKINDTGGINGRKLELITLNDAYDPLIAAKNVHQLLDKEKVFAFMGNMGSAPAILTLPIINERKIILFAPITGNNIYRKSPPDQNVFNFRASLEDETKALINGVLSIGIKPNEIAFFTQQDSFGENVYLGAMNALKAAGYDHPENLPYATFVRGTLNVEDALARIKRYAKVAPKAFVLGGNYTTNSKFIKLAKHEYPDAIFLSVSGRITPADFKKEDEKNVITVELAPNIDSTLPAILEYRSDLRQYGHGAQPNAASLEGYLSAKLFVSALLKAAEKNNLTTNGVINTLENMHNVDIGIGIDLGFDKNNHQALHTVWPVLLQDGKFITFKWTDLGHKK